jgi:hypothetical protein
MIQAFDAAGRRTMPDSAARNLLATSARRLRVMPSALTPVQPDAENA